MASYGFSEVRRARIFPRLDRSDARQRQPAMSHALDSILKEACNDGRPDRDVGDAAAVSRPADR